MKKINNWRRKVEVIEYDSNTIPKSLTIGKRWSIKDKKYDKYKHPRPDFEVSCFELLISTGKSILTTAHRYNEKAAIFARSYIEPFEILLDEKDGYLAFDYENKDILRDFSKGTRHGEIAQGINYLYAKKCLDAYAVYDFKYYAYTKKKCSSKCIGKSPDYIYCRGKDHKIGILESKGTMESDPSHFLYSGHIQCENGRKYLKKNKLTPANSYVSAISFGTTSPRLNRHTSIYISDPENDNCFVDADIKRNSLYEYSKLFYLVGNKDATEKLMRGETLTKRDLGLTEHERITDKTLIGEWEFKHILNKKPVMLKLGLKSALIEYLMSNNIQALDTYEHKFSENSETFEDGSFIMVE